MIVYCSDCDRPLRNGQQVKAVIVSTYKELASKRVYAIGTPTDCLELSHVRCSEYDY